MRHAPNSPPPPGELILYQEDGGRPRLQVRMVDETVWLTQLQMAELFGRDKSVISRHIRNAVEEGEVEEAATVAKFATVQNEGDWEVERSLDYYNLEVIISVGYSVKSQAGVQFRRWATGVLKEYIRKGFALDDVRMKELEDHYFDQSLARVREIHSSETVMYGKKKELFSTSKQNVSLHAQNIFEPAGLQADRTVKQYLTVAHSGYCNWRSEILIKDTTE